jgi:hypothetical protein
MQGNQGGCWELHSQCEGEKRLHGVGRLGGRSPGTGTMQLVGGHREHSRLKMPHARQSRQEWSSIWLMCLCLACMQLGWGAGVWLKILAEATLKFYY